MELIPLSQIDDNPYQTRIVYDPEALQELAGDIRAHGLLQPPIGRIVDHDGQFLDPDDSRALQTILYPGSLVAILEKIPPARVQLAFGHRRLRALRLLAEQNDMADAGVMPVDLRRLTDEDMARFAWSENAKRKDLSPVEAARAIQQMINTFRWTQDQVAEKLGLSRPTVSNKLRLLELPDDVLTRVAAGEISERQASALLPMYKLPKGSLSEANKGYGYPKPEQVVKFASSKSSDQIRDDVFRVIENATLLLNGHWTGQAFDDRGLRAPVCNACPERIKQGDEYRCPWKTCFARKEELYRQDRLQQASAASGIPVATEELGWDTYHRMTDVPHVDQVIAKGCPNLRLRHTGPGALVHPDGFDDVEIICLHGKDHKCTCGRSAKAAETRADPDRQAQLANQKQVEKTILEPARAAVLAALLADGVEIWKEIANAMSFHSSLSGERTVEQWKAQAARALLEKAVYLPLNASLDVVKQHYEVRLKALGVAIPWQTTELEQLQRRHDRIKGWIQNKSWWAFSYEVNLQALAGNVDNLQQLKDDLLELRTSTDEHKALEQLLATVEADLALLQALLPIGEAINAQERRNPSPDTICRGLLEKAPAGIEFEQMLAAARLPEVRYALLLADANDTERGLALTKALAQLEPEEKPA